MYAQRIQYGLSFFFFSCSCSFFYLFAFCTRWTKKKLYKNYQRNRTKKKSSTFWIGANMSTIHSFKFIFNWWISLSVTFSVIFIGIINCSPINFGINNNFFFFLSITQLLCAWTLFLIIMALHLSKWNRKIKMLFLFRHAKPYVCVGRLARSIIFLLFFYLCFRCV